MRIGLFGGSFNPIHHGHRLIAQAAAERLRTDRMLVIPSARPPHKGEAVIDPGHRLAMCRAAIADTPGFEVCDLELRRPGPSYSILTVEELRAANPGAEFYWVIGGDMLADLETWHRIDELAALCTFVTVGRPGWDKAWALERLARRLDRPQVERIAAHILHDVPLLELSSTEIRARIAAGRSVRWHVPSAVADHIAKHGLYR